MRYTEEVIRERNDMLIETCMGHFNIQIFTDDAFKRISAFKLYDKFMKMFDFLNRRDAPLYQIFRYSKLMNVPFLNYGRRISRCDGIEFLIRIVGDGDCFIKDTQFFVNAMKNTFKDLNVTYEIVILME